MRSPDHAVYVISVAAELAGMHPQTLRIYERRGLVQPQRTQGGNRRYSEADIDRLRRISELAAEGMNLEGIRVTNSTRPVTPWHRRATSPNVPCAATSSRCDRASPCSDRCPACCVGTDETTSSRVPDRSHRRDRW
jgi:DNA-binding transcriptional MerR regulator